MFPYDVAVWERFLDNYGKLYEGFYYDIMCGKPAKRFPHWETKYTRDAEILSRLRIDAVGVRADGLDIIEVKPRANMASIGQVLTYKQCFFEDYNPPKSLRALIVAAEIDQNIIPLLEKEGIVYIQI